MPERHSSPGEVTARPEAGHGNVMADARGLDGGAHRGGTDRGGTDRAVDQVTEQVTAVPEAVDAAPARPGDAAPTAGDPVADGGSLAAVAADAETATDATSATHGAVAADGAAMGATTVEAAAAAGPPPGEEPATGAAEAGSAGPVAAGPVEESPTVATRSAGERGLLFETSDAVATQLIPRSAAPNRAPTPAPAGAVGDAPTELIQLPAVPPVPPDGAAPDEPADGGGAPRKAKRRLLVVAGVVALLGLVYGADLLFSSGSVPRGTTVAGVPVGGLSLADAEQTLRTRIEPRTTAPVAVTVGAARSQLDPRAAGLAVDWAATLNRAGSQPLNPITRLTSFFTSRDVGVVTSTDRAALDAALAQLAPIVDKAPVEGSVRFDGVTPVAVNPVPGQKLDAPGAAAVLERDWASGAVVALPLTELPAVTTADDVAAAIEKVAKPAVSAPVTVLGENGARGTLSPTAIAAALSFRADPTGLVPAINTGAVTEALKPQLAGSEKPGRDAALDFSSGAPVVVPSQDGRGIDYEATLKDLLPVLTGTGPRQITAVYADQPAKLTTEQLGKLGISGLIGEFQTGGFAADSGQNIKRAADQLNGKIVQPGETFSLNAATNPRDAAHGYVEAGIIENGHSARGIGGGVSQVATTLYNASYFAGMTNVEHKEHSFYISRYPAGREATVFDDIIDLKFRNDNPTAVMIQTAWAPGSLTVRIFGTKVWDVTSASGPRTNPTDPNTITIPAGEHCTPSKGAPGFTITNTRTLKNVKTGEVRTDPTRTVKYNPSPIVNCGG